CSPSTFAPIDTLDNFATNSQTAWCLLTGNPCPTYKRRVLHKTRRSSVKNCFLSLLAIAIIAIVFTSLASAQAPQRAFVWSQSTGMTDLGTLGGTDSFGGGINDSGIVVGTSFRTGSNIGRAFRWTRSGGMHILPDFGFGSYALDINNPGQ